MSFARLDKDKDNDESKALLHYTALSIEDSSAHDIEDAIYYPSIYYPMIALGVFNIVALIPGAYSNIIYVDQGATTTMQMLGCDLASLPDNYGDTPSDLITQGNPAIEALGFSGGTAEILFGSLQVSVSGGAKMVDKQLHRWINGNMQINTSALPYKIIVYSGFGLGSFSRTYAFIDKLQPAILSLFGTNVGYVLLGLQFSGCFVVGYLIGYGPKCKEGIEFWLSFDKRQFNSKSMPLKIQIISECGVVIFVSTFFAVFGFGHLGKAINLNEVASAILGMFGGCIYGTHVLMPATYKNYAGNATLITEIERNLVYQNKYGEMSNLKRLFFELKRGFLIGYAEGGIMLYILSWELGLPLALGLTGAALRYWLFCNAELNKEITEIIEKQKPEEAKSIFKSNGYGTMTGPKPAADKQPLPATAIAIANSISVAQQVTRVFSNVYSCLDNIVLSKYMAPRTRVAVGLYTGIIIAYNRFLTFTPYVAENLSGFFNAKPPQRSPADVQQQSWRNYLPGLCGRRGSQG